MARVRFDSILCRKTEDVGADHPYLKWWNGPTIWGPVRMQPGFDQSFGHPNDYTWPLPPSGTGLIELWEQDDLGPDDHLGSREISAAELGKGLLEAPFNEDEAQYIVRYEVIP